MSMMSMMSMALAEYRFYLLIIQGAQQVGAVGVYKTAISVTKGQTNWLVLGITCPRDPPHVASRDCP